MDNWIGYILVAAIAALTLFFGWCLIIGVCIIADALGLY